MNRFNILHSFQLLTRLPQSFGFGVQSPSAYYFIKYVINEKCPYYSYDLLKDFNQGISDDYIKIYQLYFRITNFLQPALWIDFSENSSIVRKYVQAARNHIVFHVDSNMLDVHSFDIARIDVANHELFSKLVQMSTENSLIIIEKIYSTPQMTTFWNQIKLDNRVSVTFDLFVCGLVFFDHRSPKNYKLLLR